jgi:hypothetical protein
MSIDKHWSSGIILANDDWGRLPVLCDVGRKVFDIGVFVSPVKFGYDEKVFGVVDVQRPGA